MATTVKRRTSERKHTRKPAAQSLVTLGPKGWGDEVLSLCSFAAGFFLLASLLSQLVINGEPALMNELEDVSPTQNVMGPVGHFMATLLGGVLGWCAFVAVAWFIWLGSYFWTYDKKQATLKVGSPFFWTLGLLSSLIFSAALTAVFWDRAGGGSLGITLSQPLLRFFNLWGATLFLSVGLILSLAVVTRQNAGALIIGIFGGLQTAAEFLFLTVPQYILYFSEIALQISWNIVSRVSGGAIKAFKVRAAARQKTEPILPPPRVRKNSFVVYANDKKRDGEPARSEEQSLSKSVEKVVPEAETDIVVSRRKSDFRFGDKQAGKKSAPAARKKDAPPPIEYVPPSIELLKKGESNVLNENDEELIQTSRQIEAKLRDFNIQGRVTQVHPGPVITLYEFEPAPGVKVGKISALQDDLAMSLRALSIRIIAPIPRRGTVGIEVPNKHKEIVRLRDVLESEAFANAESILSVPLGKDTYGEPTFVDIAQMPHLLMAGATGTGKSVCINTLLLSLLYRATPAELGLILIDPKILELSVYEGIPHLKVPVVTNARQAKAVLDWAVKEMERRYRLMQKFGVRNIDGYNAVVKGEPQAEPGQSAKSAETLPLAEEDEDLNLRAEKAEPIDGESGAQTEIQFKEQLQPLPKIVIVIDELADLMLTVGREIEELITRLAQKARAAGIHLILATQRPSVDVITGLIKANFPARLSFRVTSRIDSRTILDAMGAEKLLGRGDTLFMAPGSIHLKRVHGAFVSDDEVKRVIEKVKSSAVPQYDQRIMQICEQALIDEEDKDTPEGEISEDEYDSVYDKAVELVVQKGQASTSMLQRAFRIGYNRAARIIDMMEKEGVIGPMDGVKPREVLVQNAE